jgi:hypothetical protein
MEHTKIILEGFDVFDTVSFISRMNRRYQATLLSQVEDLIGRNHADYPVLRKLILDSTNEFTRSVVKNIFGDIDVQ